MSNEGGLSAPESLSPRHVVEGFHCGREALDVWLVQHALQDHRAKASRSRVVCRDGRVVGFYSLAAGSVAPEAAPRRVTAGLARHPVPVVLLTRLGVDLSLHGRGIGTDLLRDALLHVLEVSETVGVRALLVNAKDSDAMRWYMSRAEFEECPSGSLQLFLLIKDLQAAVS